MTVAPTEQKVMRTSAIIKSQFDAAADLLGLEPYMRRLLIMPNRSLAVEVPVRMDDGSFQIFRGYRVQHNGARGPCKGGIRFHPEAEQAAVVGLATTTAWKTALADIPFAGAKGRGQRDPSNL